MPSIWTMGEILVEIMRPRPDMPLSEPGEFLGPYPSGVPAIFIDAVARLGREAGITGGIVGGVGQDGFGRAVLDRLQADGVDCSNVRRTGRPCHSRRLRHLLRRRLAPVHLPHRRHARSGGRRHPRKTRSAIPTASTSWVAHSWPATTCAAASSTSWPSPTNTAHASASTPTSGPNCWAIAHSQKSSARSWTCAACSCPAWPSSPCSAAATALRRTWTTSSPRTRWTSSCSSAANRAAPCTRDDRHSGGIDIPAYAIDEVDPTGAGDCFDGVSRRPVGRSPAARMRAHGRGRRRATRGRVRPHRGGLHVRIN